MRVLLAASALLLAAAPGSASQKAGQVPDATPTGAPIDCINSAQVRETKVRDDQTIDFIMSNRKVFRNMLDGGKCPGLSFERRFLHKTAFGKYCSTDIITVLMEPGLMQGASCGLGKFQPVTLASN
jgi:hypothetical protein